MPVLLKSLKNGIVLKELACLVCSKVNNLYNGTCMQGKHARYGSVWPVTTVNFFPCSLRSMLTFVHIFNNFMKRASAS